MLISKNNRLISITAGILLIMSISHPSFSQISYGGRPVVQGLSSHSEVPVISMPVFDHDIYRQQAETQSLMIKPLVFARSFEVSIDPENHGFWEQLDNGSRVWRVAIRSGGALSLNIIFSKYVLQPGVSVFIYNRDRSHILGAFTHLNNKSSKSLATEPVAGDELIIELQVNPHIEYYGELIIGSINHDFTGILDNKSSRFGTSGECNIDINCSFANSLQTEKNAVARVLVNGTRYCTGVLVNNTSGNGTPYFLTANHCIENNEQAENTVFVFGYESPFCNGGNGSAGKSLSGSEMLVTQENLDFTLVEISTKPPVSYQPWYAGWNRSATTPSAAFTIHHPQGDVKKLSAGFDSPATGTFGSGYTANGHWKINKWDIGTTESGSSGSPLFDSDGLVRGVLTGGEARCGYSVNDFYTKFSLAWARYEGINQQLKPWLDPLDTGAEILNGMNPYADGQLSAGFQVSTTEICIGEQVVFTDFSTGDVNAWLWDFGPGASPPSATTRGPHHVEYLFSGTRTVMLTIADNSSTDTIRKDVSIDVKTDRLPVAGFSYTEKEYSVQFHDLSQNAASFYWEFGDNTISMQREPVRNYKKEPEVVYTVKQFITNRACMDTVIHQVLVTYLPPVADQPHKKVTVFPVPARNFITVQTDLPFEEDTVIELITITGRTLLTNNLSSGETSVVLELESVPPGTYLLRITAGKEHVTTRITVI
jgi:lysyl endopeptidase